MIARQRRHELRFLQEAFSLRQVDFGRAQDLDRHASAERNIFGLENDAHPAFAQHAQDAVSAQATELVILLGRRQQIGARSAAQSQVGVIAEADRSTSGCVPVADDAQIAFSPFTVSLPEVFGAGVA